jgi:uncharacterized RDD family membrane protein YckC
MLLDERIAIETPEGVGLELTLAGLGSRFIAVLIDSLLKGVVLLGLYFALVREGDVGLALFSIGSFLLFYGYDVLFEVLAGGRTPGKRWSGLRVVTRDGRPVGLVASAIRNLLRLVDFLPSVYIAGSVSILASRDNQRLGDMVAGTIVVRERGSTQTRWAPVELPVIADELVSSDVSGLGETELIAVRRFLERREQIGIGPRAQLADELERRLRPRVAGIPPSYRGEQFLEAVVAIKATRT